MTLPLKNLCVFSYDYIYEKKLRNYICLVNDPVLNCLNISILVNVPAPPEIPVGSTVRIQENSSWPAKGKVVEKSSAPYDCWR